MATHNPLRTGDADIENGLPIAPTNDAWTTKQSILFNIGAILLFAAYIVLFIFSMKADKLSLVDVHDMCPNSSMKQYATASVVRYYAQLAYYRAVIEIPVKDYTWIINVVFMSWGIWEFAIVPCAINLQHTELYIVAVIDLTIAIVYLIINIAYFFYKSN
jgi:hypothetical protein